MLDRAAVSSQQSGQEATTIRVWDLGVRLFHWLLVAGVAITAVTGFLGLKTWVDVHVIAGTVITALLVFQLVWGLLGPTYARFISFVVSPLEAARHALDLVRGRAEHHLGHNPLGATMILVLLITLAALSLTGTIVLGGTLKEGPLASITSYVAGRTAKEIHEFLAFALLGLIALHVSGIIFESSRTRENLVRGMITGDKRNDAASVAAPARRPRRALAAVLTLSVCGGAGGAIAHYSLRPALGVPTAALDAAYVKECGACHTPHHPSLAPAATWSGIMANLATHFGDNAELDAAQAQALLKYTTANSAEAWDTAAANRLRIADATGSLRITDGAGWKRLHRSVPTDAFKAKKVAGKLNCAACHADAATGRFHPRSISIPKE